MKSGEVAVENSVDALRELKSGKLKDRTAMVHVSPPHSHFRQQSRQHEPRLAHFQPHLFAQAPMPYQPQPLIVLQSHPAVATIQQQGVYGPKTNPFGMKRAATANRYVYQQPPPPPLPQREPVVKRGLKQNLGQPPPPPPLSLPVQLQASAGISIPRQAKRNICVRYTRGSCYYGSSCKFFHGDDGSTAMPQSAPGGIAACVQPPQPPVPAEPKQSKASSSLHEVEFPSLSAKTNASDHCAGSDGTQYVVDLRTSSSSKKLVFLDAVLQQKCKAYRVKPADVSPIKLQAGDPTSADATKAHSSNQNLDETDEECEHSQIAPMNVQAPRGNQPQLPIHNRVPNASSRQDPKDNLLRRVSLQPQHSNNRPRLQSVLPEPGERRYAVQPVYVNGQGASTDDSAAFSILGRDANGFVQRLDSRLRELYPFQERAITMLQDVVASIWSDSTISVYGSSFTRLALPQSDIDCVLSAPSQTSDQPSELLRKLASELRHHPWARSVDLVDSAKIPVLKVVFCHSSKPRNEVMLDLTCAHSPGHSGLSARDLIYSYQVEMPALRPLVLILKSHILRRGLNSAFTGGMSSYGLVILAIRFLQACGDEHHVGETFARLDGGYRVSEAFGHAIGYNQLRSGSNSSSPPVYEFTRDGNLTWRTGLGNLLLLFLETYVTFDYRRFGVTIEGSGLYFPLPSDMVSLDAGAVVSPYIVDPISPTRSIGNSFRMHEIIQAWYELYQQLTNGVSIDDAINSPNTSTRST